MSDNSKKGKVTGLGGVFFKSKDPEALKKWYENNLGLPCDQHGHLFEWLQTDAPTKKGFTQFGVFNSDTEYMQPSQKDYMINFRVDDVVIMIERLKKAGMKVIGDIDTYSYGKFAWVMDPDGNKVELWEPIDETFE
ncbi:MAG: VOC family protein [Bacteroidetes bacterium]|nr:VOC family protein [Bacteroidota bacterium]